MKATTRNSQIYHLIFLIVIIGIVLPWQYTEGNMSLVLRNQNNGNQMLKGVTKRENKLLNRKKRYLTFPAGASFIMTISLIKSLMIKAPTGLRLAGECDVPFSLPSDSRWIHRRKGNRRRQRREVLEQLSMGFESLGFNGTACIRRAICDARSYLPLKGTSLVKDLLMMVFTFEEQGSYRNYCNKEVYNYCDFPFLNYIEGLMEISV